jgi:hypothetical protein
MIGKVRRLALALVRGGPFGRQGLALAEPEDAAILEPLTRARPLYPRLLDQPPATAERPFQSLADLARAAAAVERAAAAQAMLRGLGVEAGHVAPGAAWLAESGVEVAAVDVGLLARTILVKRLLSVGKAPAVAALDPRDVRAFEAQTRPARGGPAQLPAALAKRARALLEAAAPQSLAAVAVAAVADRWIAALAPLEPVLVQKPLETPPAAKRPPAPRTTVKRAAQKPKANAKPKPKAKAIAKAKAKGKAKRPAPKAKRAAPKPKRRPNRGARPAAAPRRR